MIGQTRRLARRLRARLRPAESSGDALQVKIKALGDQTTSRSYGASLAKVVRPYSRGVPQESDAYWQDLHRVVADATTPLPAESWSAMGVHDRVCIWLIAHNRRHDVVAALVDRSENGSSFRCRVEWGRIIAEPGYLPLLSATLDKDLLVLDPDVFHMAAQLERVRWVGSVLEIEGFAYLKNVDFERFDCNVEARLVNPTGELGALSLTTALDPAIDVRSRDRFNSYAPSAFTVSIPAALFDAGAGSWIELSVSGTLVNQSGPFTARNEHGAAALLPAGEHVQCEFDSKLGLALVPRAASTVTGQSAGAVIADRAALDEGGQSFTISGRLRVGTTVLTPVMLGQSRAINASAVRIAGDRFETTFPLVQTRWGNGGLAIDSGNYRFTATVDGDCHPFAVAGSLLEDFPQELAAAAAWLGFSRDPTTGSLELAVTTPLGDDERGRLNQRRLHDLIPALNTRTELLDAAVFECFGGKSGGDNVRPVFEEFALRHPSFALYWGVTDRSVPVPAGAIPVLLHSRRWYEVLHTAKVLINNANFPYYFRKSPGQVYLQTWHGTPLKRIGNDVPNANLSLSYRSLMGREARYWDLLLAQNDFAARTMSAAFGYRGDILTTGYPRNDVLHSPDRDQIAARVRSLLGIGARTKIILYAPTWRDDVRTSSKLSELVSHLDFDVAARSLESGHVFLQRGHSNTAKGRTAPRGGNVIDVTDYPDIAELFLVADVLISDYSSVIFDFCITGKPIILLTPDLERYRDSTRGFYFDIEEQAPGPLVRTTAEVVQAIDRVEGLHAEYGQRYENFRRTYAGFDDGQSTSRVLDALAVRLS